MSRGAHWSVLAVGAAFGFLLTVSGLGDYDTIHDGLLLENLYIFGMMGSAMAVAFAGLAVLRRLGRTRFAGPLALPHGSSAGTSTAVRCSGSASGSAPPALA